MDKKANRERQKEKWIKTQNKDDLFYYRLIKKVKLSEKQAKEYLAQYNIQLTPKMIRARKEKLKSIRINKKICKQKKQKSELFSDYDFDIPWLDDDCSDTRWQMEMEWLLNHPFPSPEEEKQNHTIIISEDDLPF